MAHNPTLLMERNANIKKRYRHHRKRNPKWTLIAVIQETAKEFYLSPATVSRILKEEDANIPCVDTVAKYTRLTAYLTA